MLKTAAILIGGLARRLGGLDKSRLEIAGLSMLDHQRRALDGLVERIVLIGRGDATAAAGDLLVIPDARPGCGSLGGILTALRTADGPVLVLACDLPFVTRAFLAFLCDVRGDHDAVVPRTADGIHPLCAVYAPACLPVIARQVDIGQFRVADALEHLRVRDVGPDEVERFDPDGLLLTNVNTPDDLARARAHTGGSSRRTTP